MNEEELIEIVKLMEKNGESPETIAKVVAEYDAQMAQGQPQPEPTPLKKKDDTDFASEDGFSVYPGIQVSDTTSDITKPQKDLSPSQETPAEDIGPGEEILKSLGSGILYAAGGLSGVPDMLNKIDFQSKYQLLKLFAGKEEKASMEKAMAKLQALPKDERDALIQDMQNEGSPIKRFMGYDWNKDLVSATNNLQNKFADQQEDLNKTRRQYETEMVDDLLQGDIGQFSTRIVSGIAESAPLMLATIFGGPVGLGAMGGTVASAKLEDLEREGQDVDVSTLANSQLRGVAEVVGGRVLQNIFKPVVGRLTRGQAEKVSRGVYEKLSKAAGNFRREFLEETGQNLQEELTDLLLADKEIEGGWEGLWKRSVGAGLIGGFATAPSALGYKSGDKEPTPRQKVPTEYVTIESMEDPVELANEVSEKKRQIEELEEAGRITGVEAREAMMALQRSELRAMEAINNPSVRTQGFFSDVVQGKLEKYKPSKPYEYEQGFTPEQSKFRDTYDQFKGNFDEHIATSIPTFRDNQVKKGEAIVSVLPQGGLVYDLGGSEGGFAKAITTQSEGKIRTINVEPQGNMAAMHDKNPVEGSEVVPMAFQKGWDGVEAYRPQEKADVVHESMLFQFMGPTRADKIKEVKENYLKEDGLFITEQKFKQSDVDLQRENERIKDTRHKSKYYTQQQIDAKEEGVLVGMGKNQANIDEYLSQLREEFEFVDTYWKAGNFQGIVATNNEAQFQAFMDRVGKNETDYTAQKQTEVQEPEPPAVEQPPQSPEDFFKDRVEFSMGDPIYHSTAEGAIAQIDQPAATPTEWMSKISQKGGKGVTQELDWIGLEEFMKSYVEENKVGSVPRGVVEKFIQQNRVQIVEVVKDDAEITRINEALAEAEEEYRKAREDLRMLAGILETLEGQERSDLYNGSYTEALARADLTLKRVRELRSQQPNIVRTTAPKYKSWSFAGEGAGYKEYVLILGNQVQEDYETGHWDEKNILAHIRVSQQENSNGERVLFIEEVQSDWAQDVRKHGPVTKEQLERLEEIDKAFREARDAEARSNAFRESTEESLQENVALLRDKNGNQLYWGPAEAGGEVKLFAAINKLGLPIGEVGNYKVRQDQRGDFYISDTKEPRDNYYVSRELAQSYLEKMVLERQPFSKVLYPESKMTPEMKRAWRNVKAWSTEVKKIERPLKEALEKGFVKYRESTMWNDELEDQLIKNLPEDLGSIPDMPYKKTDQWVGLLVRRALKMASDQGLDRIAWTTGEQQTERFGLDKNVESIEWWPNEEGLLEDEAPTSGMLVIHKKGQPNSPIHEKEHGVGELPAIIGQELTDKILDPKLYRQEGMPAHILRGDNLKIGGQGMKTFYNSILPKVAKNEARRFDKKAQVDVVDLSDVKPGTGFRLWEKSTGKFLGSYKGAFWNRDGDGTETRVIPDDYKSPEEVLKELGLTESQVDISYTEQAGTQKDHLSKQLSIKITPKMREELSGSIPQFEVRSQLSQQIADQEYLESMATLFKQNFPDVEVEISRAKVIEAGVNVGLPPFIAQRARGLHKKSGLTGKRSVILNPEVATKETPIHEFGHIWMDVARTERPALWKKGMALIKGSVYEQELRASLERSPAMRKAYPEKKILDEAMAMAIGDKGVQLMSDAKKSSAWRRWLSELYDLIKKKFNLPTKAQIEDLTLGEFVELASMEILTGQRLVDSDISKAGRLLNRAKARLGFSIPEGRDTRIAEAVQQAKEAGLDKDEVRRYIAEKAPEITDRNFEEMWRGTFQESQRMSLEEIGEESRRQMREFNGRTWAETKQKIINTFLDQVVDRQSFAKRMIRKNMLPNTNSFMVAAAGASAAAKRFMDRVEARTTRGLTSKQIGGLEEMIFAQRVIAIDQNRKERGLPPVRHPGGMDAARAQREMESYKEKYGETMYRSLQVRADAYFDAYREILTNMREEGLIDQEFYDKFKDLDYQPRQFLQHMKDMYDNFLVEELTGNETISLARNQIETMLEGSEGMLNMDALGILQASALTRHTAVFNNRLNTTFAKEFRTRKHQIDELREKAPEMRTEEENTAIERFEMLEQHVRLDEISDYTKDGKPKYKMAEENTRGGKFAYYYIDGVKNRIWMRDEFYDKFTNTNNSYLPASVRENVALFTGTASVKTLATGNNPLFFLTNLPRDFMFVATFSREYGSNVLFNAVELAREGWKGIQAVRYDKEIYGEFLNRGGGMDYLALQGKYKDRGLLSWAAGEVIHNKNIEPIYDEVRLSKGAMAIKEAKQWIDKANLASEMGLRVAVFQKSINNQLKELGLSSMEELSDNKEQQDIIYAKAIKSARELTDFSQGGKAIKALDAAVPYLNAATQGLRAAASAVKADPGPMTFRLFQSTALAAGAVFSATMASLALFRDDEDEVVAKMTNGEIYFETMEGVSEYDRLNYFIIPTGRRDANGEWWFIRIAKAQTISPFINFSEGLIRGVASNRLDIEYKQDIGKDLLTTIETNILPLEPDPTKAVKRIPAVDATFAMAGLDAYTGNPLSWDMGNIPPQLEGIVDDRTQPFFKAFGEMFGKSPIRLQSAMESFITTPSTNVYVGMGYALANMGAEQSGALRQGAESTGIDFEKAALGRLVKHTSEYNKITAAKERASKEVVAVYRKHIEAEDMVRRAVKTAKADGDVEAMAQKIINVYQADPYMQDKVLRWFKSEMQYERTLPIVSTLRHARIPEVKAILLAERMGDALLRKDSELGDKEQKIIKNLIENYEVLDKETLMHYERIFRTTKKATPTSPR